MCYIIASFEGGYGYHTKNDLRGLKRQYLDGVCAKGLRESEYTPLHESEGASVLKVCGTISIEGLRKLVDNMGWVSTCKTMGSLTMEYGLLPAVSIEGEYTQHCNACTDDMERWLKRHKDAYREGVDCLCGTTHCNLYVTLCYEPVKTTDALIENFDGVRMEDVSVELRPTFRGVCDDLTRNEGLLEEWLLNANKWNDDDDPDARMPELEPIVMNQLRLAI